MPSMFHIPWENEPRFSLLGICPNSSETSFYGPKFSREFLSQPSCSGIIVIIRHDTLAGSSSGWGNNARLISQGTEIRRTWRYSSSAAAFTTEERKKKTENMKCEKWKSPIAFHFRQKLLWSKDNFWGIQSFELWNVEDTKRVRIHRSWIHYH